MLDHMAKAVNLSYVEEKNRRWDAEQAWRRTSYFSRESSRASADFIPAMLAIAGTRRVPASSLQLFLTTVVPNNGIPADQPIDRFLVEYARKKGLEPSLSLSQYLTISGRSSALLESLSITEHLRWNAFHYAMGYTRMREATIERRHSMKLTPIHKDTLGLEHACLVDWDALDGLSKRINALTNENEDYKAYDRNNILNIPRTLTLKSDIDRDRLGK